MEILAHFRHGLLMGTMDLQIEQFYIYYIYQKPWDFHDFLFGKNANRLITVSAPHDAGVFF